MRILEAIADAILARARVHPALEPRWSGRPVELPDTLPAYRHHDRVVPTERVVRETRASEATLVSVAATR